MQNDETLWMKAQRFDQQADKTKDPREREELRAIARGLRDGHKAQVDMLQKSENSMTYGPW